MASLEMVEKLRQRANVSYDEAKAALEACNDDLLEAMIYLERQGRVAPPPGSGYYSTQEQQAYQDPGQQQYYYKPKGETFGDVINRLWNWIVKMVEKGNNNSFEVWRNGKRTISLPVTALVLLTVFCFWVVIPALIVGLFMRCKYRFVGPELAESAVNNVMETASKVADDLKQEVSSRKNGEQ